MGNWIGGVDDARTAAGTATGAATGTKLVSIELLYDETGDAAQWLSEYALQKCIKNGLSRVTESGGGHYRVTNAKLMYLRQQPFMAVYTGDNTLGDAMEAKYNLSKVNCVVVIMTNDHTYTVDSWSFTTLDNKEQNTKKNRTIAHLARAVIKEANPKSEVRACAIVMGGSAKSVLKHA